MGSSPSTSREASTTSVLRPVPLALVVILLTLGCLNPEKGNETERQPPAGKPEGLLIERIPSGADVIFSSVRHVSSSASSASRPRAVIVSFAPWPAASIISPMML